MTSNFKPIPGYENYLIDHSGNILRPYQKRKKHTYKEMPISTRIDKRSGYPVVKLTSSNHKYSTKYIHRILALTFIDNVENKPYVNHKNGNKLDYSLENLHWVTASENTKHAIQNKLSIPFQKTPVIDICTDKEYGSIKEAAKHLGVEYKVLKSTLVGIVSCLQCIQRKNNNVSIN